MEQYGIEPLVEAIYDASLDPTGWIQAMALVRESFDTGAACLYSLDYGRRRMQPVEVVGVAPRFVASFESTFYTKDNPSTRTPALHRPGVVRTERSLDDYFGGAGVLRQSRYYHEWLQPQGFAHTMGVTPLAQHGIVVNLSLLRSPAAGPFRGEEIARFSRLQVHLRRALQMGQRLEGLAVAGSAMAEALERLGHAVIFASSRGRVLHSNAAAERLLRRGDGLRLRGGRLSAVDPATQQGLARLLSRPQEAGHDGTGGDSRTVLPVPRAGGQRPLLVSALPVSARAGRFVMEQASVMLLVTDPTVPRDLAFDLLPALYGFTPAEARLARELLAGGGLRAAAARAGMSYETGRWYLKVLLQKTQTSRQAELVALLHSELATRY